MGGDEPDDAAVHRRRPLAAHAAGNPPEPEKHLIESVSGLLPRNSFGIVNGAVLAICQLTVDETAYREGRNGISRATICRFVTLDMPFR